MQVPEFDSRERLLQKWQSALQASILDPRFDRKRLRAWLRSGSVDVDIQLEIYASAYVMRLTEALQCNYPVMHLALGDKDFELMARVYIDRFPSVDASIRWFGDRLSGFLRDRQPYCEVPALSELASFEWAIRHTVDADDGDYLTVESLLSVPVDAWDGLKFDLHPSVTILSLQWNAPQLWRALSDQESDLTGSTLTPVRQAMHWLVYRKRDLVSSWYSMSVIEKAAMDCLQQGGTFADICACIAEYEDSETAKYAAGLLRSWVDQGILVRP